MSNTVNGASASFAGNGVSGAPLVEGSFEEYTRRKLSKIFDEFGEPIMFRVTSSPMEQDAQKALSGRLAQDNDYRNEEGIFDIAALNNDVQKAKDAQNYMILPGGEVVFSTDTAERRYEAELKSGWTNGAIDVEDYNAQIKNLEEQWQSMIAQEDALYAMRGDTKDQAIRNQIDGQIAVLNKQRLEITINYNRLSDIATSPEGYENLADTYTALKEKIAKGNPGEEELAAQLKSLDDIYNKVAGEKAAREAAAINREADRVDDQARRNNNLQDADGNYIYVEAYGRAEGFGEDYRNQVSDLMDKFQSSAKYYADRTKQYAESGSKEALADYLAKGGGDVLSLDDMKALGTVFDVYSGNKVQDNHNKEKMYGALEGMDLLNNGRLPADVKSALIRTVVWRDAHFDKELIFEGKKIQGIASPEFMERAKSLLDLANQIEQQAA